jgi:alpha-acetolactate decarboxylase
MERNDPVLWTRRTLIHAGAKGCLACAAISLGLAPSHAARATRIDGQGYSLWFIGSQREAMMMGKRSAVLDLRTLKGRPNLYGLGPLEWLGGEITIVDGHSFVTRLNSDRSLQVTESFEAGAPFFVWAEVAAWDMISIPAGVETLQHVQSFVAEAGRQRRLTQAFPFLMSGSAETVEFHVGNSTPDTPAGMEAAMRNAVPFKLRRQPATYVGFWSNRHHGIFTHADQDIHVHLLTLDNKTSGHVDALRAGPELKLGLPKA